jgi:hypothetical protein
VKPDQWFTLWMTLSQVLVGGVATLAAVWIGAALALRGQRRSASEQRSRLAAERCLAAIDEASEQTGRLRHQIKFAQEYKWPLSKNTKSQVINAIIEIHDKLLNTDISHEAWLLGDRRVVENIAGCVDGLVRLHLDSFGHSMEETQERVALLYRGFGQVGDQLRAIMLRKNVDQLTSDDRHLTYLLQRPRHLGSPEPSGGAEQTETRPTGRLLQFKKSAANWRRKLQSQLGRLRRSRPRTAAAGGRPQGRP